MINRTQYLADAAAEYGDAAVSAYLEAEALPYAVDVSADNDGWWIVTFRTGPDDGAQDARLWAGVVVQTPYRVERYSALSIVEVLRTHNPHATAIRVV